MSAEEGILEQNIPAAKIWKTPLKKNPHLTDVRVLQISGTTVIKKHQNM